MNMHKTLVAVSIITSSLCGFPLSGWAALPDDAPVSERIVVADATPLTLEEMQNIRGGFMDPTGLIYNFAVNVQTAINGAEIFSRSITVSPSGLGGQLAATASSNLFPQNLPSNFSVSMIGNGNGIVVNNTANGTTTALNQTASGVPASIVLNTSNNSNIAQTVSLALTLKNLSSVMNLAHLTIPPALAQNGALRGLGF
jgi:hypothetical protein